MAPYFPFARNDIVGRVDAKVYFLVFGSNTSLISHCQLLQALQHLSLIFCQMTSLFGLVSSTNYNGISHRKQSHMSQDSMSSLKLQTEQINDYVIELLGNGEPNTRIGRVLTPETYISLLPTIWYLLNGSTHNPRPQLWQAVLVHAARIPSTAALKLPTVQFVASVVLVSHSRVRRLGMLMISKLGTEPHYRGQFTVEKCTSEPRYLEEWLVHLLKTLWEIGSDNLIMTTVRRLIFTICILS